MSNVTALREPPPVKKAPRFGGNPAGVTLTLLMGVAVGATVPRLLNSWLFPAPPPPSYVDGLAIHGLPAKLSCEQVRDGFGGVVIKFSASRTPEAGSQNGTSYVLTGVLGPKKAITGEFVMSSTDGKTSQYRTDGTGVVQKGTNMAIGDVAEFGLRPVAEGCRKALSDVPGEVD